MGRVMTSRAVAALGIGQCVNWGVLYYAFAILVVPLERELGMPTWVVTGAFSLVSLSALLRISGGWLNTDYFDPVAVAAICWMAGWTLFLVAYFPAMSGPVPRPAFSAALGNKVERGKGITAVEGVSMSAEHQGAGA